MIISFLMLINLIISFIADKRAPDIVVGPTTWLMKILIRKIFTHIRLGEIPQYKSLKSHIIKTLNREPVTLNLAFGQKEKEKKQDGKREGLN